MGSDQSCCNMRKSDDDVQVIGGSSMVMATPESSEDEAVDFEERAIEFKDQKNQEEKKQFMKTNSILPDSDYRKRGQDKKGKMHLPVPSKDTFRSISQHGKEENEIVLLRDLPLKYREVIENIAAIYGPFLIPVEKGRRDKKQVFDSSPVEIVNLKCFYKGQWRNKQMHGYGVLITEDEDVYEGYFQDGLPHGQGRLLYKTGDFLKGEFAQGKVHGEGKLDTTTGATIEGSFDQNKLCGKVKEVYRDGTRYEGEWCF